MSNITIYHNPKCGTSRNTLELIREAGHEPTIIEYLKTPPSRAVLEGLLQQAGIQPSDLIRSKEALYDELGLGAESVTEEQILNAIEAHPILMNRPVVVTEKGTRLCRPKEVVLEIL